MRSYTRAHTLVIALAAAGLMNVGCGQWSAPSLTGPSGLTGPSVLPAPPASGTSTISGTLNAGSSANRLTTAGSGSNITVTVVGTNLSASVDFFGRFVLEGVPTGSVHLHFSGTGVDATADLGVVREREQIDIKVTVKASTATVHSSIRIEADSSAEIEGIVTSVSGTCPNLSVTVHGWTVNLTSSTQSSCDGVKVGIRVRIIGHRASTSVVVVVQIVLHTEHPGDDDSNDDADDDDSHDDSKSGKSSKS